MVNFSPGPFSNPQARVGMWPYLMEAPAAAIILTTEPVMGSENADLAELLRLRFMTGDSSGGAINPVGETTVVEEPTLLTVNGQPAAKMVVAGTDTVLQKPFRAYVWAIQNGDQVLYVSSALLEQNETAFVPLIDRIAQTVVVNVPEELARQQPVATGEIVPGQTVTGTLRLSPPDQVVRDYWRFPAEAGKRYVVTATPAYKYDDIVLDVVNADGNSILGREIDAEGDGAGEHTTFQTGKVGDYFIAVRNFFLDDGGYTLEMKEAE